MLTSALHGQSPEIPNSCLRPPFSPEGHGVHRAMGRKGQAVLIGLGLAFSPQHTTPVIEDCPHIKDFLSSGRKIK